MYDFEKAKKLIKQSEKIIITTHLVPDADAIGCEFAIYEYLMQQGKSSVIINHSPTPENLLFLDENQIIKFFRDNIPGNTGLILNADLIIIVDTNEYSRLRTMQESVEKSKAKKICIDHHISSQNNFDLNISDPESPATAQILYEIFYAENPGIITKKIAVNLYAGIMTDSGSFKYPRTTRRTFEICADLIGRGVDPVDIYEKIYCDLSIGKVRLFGRFISGLEYFDGGRVVIGTVTLKDFRELGLGIQDVEGFSGFLMEIRDVIAGFVIVELEQSIKISFRSKGDIYMNEFAKLFGGGGHKNAAGAYVEKTNIEELKKKIISDFLTF